MIQPIHSPQEIAQCFEAFLELRPHLKDQNAFVDQVITQQQEGYTIAAIYENDAVVACIGYRQMTTLAWGKFIYIDDLITRAATRGKGYGGKLLRHVIDHAKELGCDQVHLDTGYGRHAAHRVYLDHGFTLNSHHLALDLGE